MDQHEGIRMDAVQFGFILEKRLGPLGRSVLGAVYVFKRVHQGLD